MAIDYDSILRATLTTINQGFENAQRDLVSVVEAVSNSLKRNANDTFNLDFTNLREDYNGTIYRIFFDENPNDLEAATITVDFFYIPSKGYPIEQGNYYRTNEEFKKHQEISSKEELELYFQEMLKDPESSLIQAIGFSMRKKL